MSLRSRFSVVKNGEEPPFKKRKTNKASPLVLPHTTISSLSDDLVLICLARVSRVYYRSLSLVSKKFRSLIASPELYKVRSLLGLTESCLYVSLRLSPDSDPSWFTLCVKPNTRKTKIKKDFRLVPIASHHSTLPRYSSAVAIGSSIYFIGGYIENAPSSNVSILDCRFHTWHQGTNMQTIRRRPAVIVVDGKIYVLGGRCTEFYDSLKCIEVLDPKTQIWNYVFLCGKFPETEFICSPEYFRSIVIDGKISMYYFGWNRKGLTCNLKEGTCEPLDWNMSEGWRDRPHCVVDNVLFSYNQNEKVFKWFDTNKVRLWKNLNGLGKVTRKIHKDSNVELVDYGGKMAVLWDRKHVRGDKSKVIWCAVIAVERCDSSEEDICGIVEWFDIVHPAANQLACALATTL